MSSLLPIRSEPTTGGQEPRVVDLEGEDAEQVFSALSSSTARQIIAGLHEEPRTQSEIAEQLDTTVQNVRYHLDKLEDAGLVEVVDTWYSSRGNEMKVYAPADGALIVSGDESKASRIRTALSRLVGGVAILGMASVVIQTLLERSRDATSQYSFTTDSGGGGAAGDGGGLSGAGAQSEKEGIENVTLTGGDAAEYGQGVSDAPEATRTVTDGGAATTTAEPSTTAEAARRALKNATPDPTTAADAATAADPGGLPPGALFFLGGASVLVALTAVWYWFGR